jgi:hypothetical protein
MKSLQEEFARRHGHCSMVELYNRKSTLKISNPIASIAAIKKDRKHLLADLKLNLGLRQECTKENT